MRTTKVDLGPRAYEIIVGTEILDSVPELLRKVGDYRNVALVADERVDDLYGDALAKRLEENCSVHRLRIASGEKSKTWDEAARLLEALAALRLRRNDVVMTLGGGMTSDLAGFVASVYQRGVDVVHVSTSLLGQVDAAIGGKTGVNLTGGKNLAGAFHQPRLVVCDVATLRTLPEREFRSGLAEVIKYGLCFDSSMLDKVADLMREGEPSKAPLLEELVLRCASIKAGVVGADETDRSGRIFLNYGHTLGHALEAAADFSALTHGEAISVGMMFAAELGFRLGLLGEEEVQLHADALSGAGLPIKAALDFESVKSYWAIDKKNEGAHRWVLLEGLNKPAVHQDVSEADVDAALSKVAA